MPLFGAFPNDLVVYSVNNLVMIIATLLGVSSRFVAKINLKACQMNHLAWLSKLLMQLFTAAQANHSALAILLHIP